MNLACFRFYAELNDFLPPARRFVAFPQSFEVSGSVTVTSAWSTMLCVWL